MRDDGFVFGDDTNDETDLFGASSDESDADAATDRRFGTTPTDDTDSRSVVGRIRTAVSDVPIRTAGIVVVAVALVVSVGAVAYPLVMGTFDTTSPAGGVDSTTQTAGGPTGSTGFPPTGTALETVPEKPTPTTVGTVGETTALTTEVPVQTPSPSPTQRTTTRVPTRAFPAGEPVSENETTARSSPTR